MSAGALVQYLVQAHAMEQQSLRMVQAAERVAGDPQLRSLYHGHVAETHGHLTTLEERLAAHDASRSILRDVAGQATALVLGGALIVQPDTPARLAAVAYAFENFEIASYELLRRLARHEGDADTVRAAETILVNERQAAEKIAASFDLALERSLTGTITEG